MRRTEGFTIVELVVAVAFLLLAGGLFLVQKTDLDTTHRDQKRKTAINAIFYNLDELYYATNGNYPEKIDSGTLKGLDPALLKDPEGRAVGEAKSDYRYEPQGCFDGKCKNIILRTKLEKEADFVKESKR
jgi:type II secretory pathway pseudopilin PulG